MRDLPKTENLKFYKIEELDYALSGTNLVVCGISSFGVDWFGKEILPKIPKNIKILSVRKGMLNEKDGNLTVYTNYWKREYDNKRDIYGLHVALPDMNSENSDELGTTMFGMVGYGWIWRIQ